MKQARRDRRGENRQEGEKPWRRNVPGGGKPGRSNVDASISMCCRGRNPRKALRALEPRDTVTKARSGRGGHTLKGAQLRERTVLRFGGERLALPGKPRGPLRRGSTGPIDECLTVFVVPRKDVEGARNQ